MQFQIHDFTPIGNAIDKIIDLIKDRYSVDIELYKNIRTNLSSFFKVLKNDLNVFIEYPYVDKVYRDSYYTYFSTKYREYSRDCIRLSFFTSLVGTKDIFESADNLFLENNFRGYSILRPTFPDIIGRNLLSKTAFKIDNFVTCIHEENILLNGFKLNIKGFPHSSQDQESITCAETTVWAIMEYFGHKYAEYKPALPSKILNKLDEYSDRRMLPSSGLTPEQISFTLKDFGFGTMIYSAADDGDDFFPDISVFTESGIPFIATIENAKIAHAILFIGREKVPTSDLVDALNNPKDKSKIIAFSSLVKKYIVQDDNLPPYSSILLDNPVINYHPKSDFESAKIHSIIVPLYKKMYMEVQRARKFFEEIFKDIKYGVKTTQKHIFRMYMASSRSFKEHTAKQKELAPDLKNLLLAVAMPRFIWCGEYINAADAPKRMVSSLIVLDATEASESWEDSFIFAVHKNKSIFYTAVEHTYEMIPLPFTLQGFSMFEHNLN